MEKDIFIARIWDMKEIYEKKTFERYAYYANNNIFDVPNAISGYSMIPSQTERGIKF